MIARFKEGKIGNLTNNYNHPIFEENVQLIDMVYLRKEI